MKILNKIVLRDLKLNKKRSIVTIIGIMLSVALICAVAGMFTCFQATILKETIQSSGYYHVKVEDVLLDDIEKLSLNNDIKDINELSEIGYAILENSQNESKPYLHVYSVNNDSFFTNLSFSLLEGRFPENENEIIISKHIETNGEVLYKLGDNITLNIGSRVLDGERLESSYYYDENEVLETEIQKTFTIVGIMERPSYTFENYSDPGYTIITNKWNGVQKRNLYLSFKNPKNYEKTISELLNIDEEQVDICSNNIECNSLYSYRVNRELLRWEIFNFSEGVFNMLLTIVAVVVAIIMGTSIFVIRNAFAISTTEKAKMIGMLKSVGATKKQIKKSVISEGMLLGLIAIPLGILAGILAVYILIIVVNLLVGDFMFGHIDGMVFKISIVPIIVSIILGFVTIYLSCLSSSKKASKISPIDSIRSSNDYSFKAKKLKTPFIIQKLFKTGGVIAYKNLKRSSKKYRTTIISLVVSIFVFITMNSFIHYGFELSGMYYTDLDYNILISGYEKEDVPAILSLDNIDTYTKTSFGTMLPITDKNIMNEWSKEYLLTDECSKMGIEEDCLDSLSMMIKILDDASYKRFVERNNLNYDDVKDKVILNDYYYYSSEIGSKYERVFKYKVGDIIQVSDYEDNVELEIGFITDDAPSGNENVYIDGGVLYVTEEYFKKHFTSEIHEDTIAITSSNPEQLVKDFEELHLDAYISNYDEYAKQQRAMILVVSIFLYGFITVITLIGVTNIFNTITTNMELRQKEFAMLKSVGMTKKEFNRMINLETLFYSTKSLIIGIIFGILGSYGVYKAFATNFDAGFDIPITAIIISIVSVFILVFFIMRFSLKKINKQNIIETIRNENI